MDRYWLLTKNHFKNMMRSNQTKSGWQKLRQSLIAIAFALLCSIILIGMLGGDPISYFSTILEGAFLNEQSTHRTLTVIAIYMTAAVAIIAGFKAGLFNIGVGGQMAISGSAVAVIGAVSSVSWVTLVLVSILISMATAAFLGILKAFFNIHEVVSAILLNYVLLYIAQYLLSSQQAWSYLGSTGSLNTGANSIMQIGDSPWLPSMLIAISLIAIIAIVFKFTTAGFSLKGVGENPTAAHYAGIQVKWQVILGMAISGIAAGALGAIYYLGYTKGQMSQNDLKSLPTIGFEGISVALIASNSFIGLFPASIFWGVLSSGSQFAEIAIPDIPKEAITLINGFMIYSIAISIIFIKFKPIRLVYNMIIMAKNNEFKAEIKKMKLSKKSTKELFDVARKNLLDQIEESRSKNDSEKVNEFTYKLKLLQMKFKKELADNDKKIFELRLKTKYGAEPKQLERAKMIEKRVVLDKKINLDKKVFMKSNKDKKDGYWKEFASNITTSLSDNNAARRDLTKKLLSPEVNSEWHKKAMNYFKIGMMTMLFGIKQSLTVIRFENLTRAISSVNIRFNALAEEAVSKDRETLEKLDIEIAKISKDTNETLLEDLKTEEKDGLKIIKTESNTRFKRIISEGRKETFIGRFYKKQDLIAEYNSKYSEIEAKLVHEYNQSIKKLKKEFSDKKSSEFIKGKELNQNKFNDELSKLKDEKTKEFDENIRIIKVFGKKVEMKGAK